MPWQLLFWALLNVVCFILWYWLKMGLRCYTFVSLECLQFLCFFCSTVLFCMVCVTFVGFSSLCYCNLSGGCGEINRWTRYALSLSHAHDWGRISMVPYKILLLLFSVYLLAACLQSVKRNLVRQSFLAVFFPNNLSFKHLLYVHIYLKLPHFILLSLTFTEWCLRKKLSLKKILKHLILDFL